MRIAVVAGGRLEQGMSDAGHEVVALATPAVGKGDATAVLAACLREFERRLGADPVDAVLVSSAADSELALAVVAAKLGIHLARVERADGDPGRDGAARALAVLADEVVESGEAPRIRAS